MPPYEDIEFELFGVTRETLASKASIAASPAGQDLLAVQQAIESRLATRVMAASGAGVHPAAIDEPDRNCLGVAVAVSRRGPRARGATRAAARGGPRVILFLAEPERPARAAERVLRAAGLPRTEIAATPVQVIVTGIVRAQSFDGRMRPAPGGVSVAHARSTAGTLGCLCTGRSAPRRGQIFILSNSHILANCNAGATGDCCSQQGPADGGVCPGDGIGSLEKFTPIDFAGRQNLVDAATALTSRALVRPEMVYFRDGQFQFFGVSSAPVPAAEHMLVGKTGRTTQLRQGSVLAVNASTIATYDECGATAVFHNQIAIQGIAPLTFSEPGDSGALVWTWTSEKHPVGLLFSGGGPMSFANHIEDVLQALDVDLVTQ